MGCNGRDRLRRNNIRNIRLIKQNAERFGIPTSSLPELTLKPSSSASASASDHHLGASSDTHGDQNRNPNPNFDESGWGYCTEDQLEELLLKNLEFLYNEAMSRLIALGYDQEIALKAILRNGHCYGNMDVLSNIVQNSVTYLSSNNVNSEEPESVFNDLRQLEEYSLTGMVCLLQQVRPHLSKGDAMWCLLMSDLHVGRASSMEIPVLPSSGNGGMPNSSNGENGNNNLNGIAPGNCKFHGGWGFGSGETCELSVSGSFQSSFDAMAVRDIECPKRFNLPPSLKSMLQRNVTMFAAGFRANAKPTMIRSYGGSAMGVTLEPEVSQDKSEGSKAKTKQTAIRTGGPAAGVTLEPEVSKEKPAGFKPRAKQTALRTGGSTIRGPGVGVTLEPEISIENSEGFKTNVRTHVIRTFGGSGMGVTLEPEDPPSKSELRIKSKPVAKRTPFPGRLTLGVPLPDNMPEKSKEPQDSQKSDVNSVLSSLGNLTLDENVEGGAPDPKNEMILNLIHQIKDLEGQVKERKEWAHQKAMQAARKLSQDLTELKMLRMEREETQRLKKGKQALEDTTMKRLNEMENALRTASGQVDRANAAVRRLETENAEIRAEMEASKLSASESVTTCLEVAKREKKCLKKLLAWEKQKSKLQEEVAEEKQNISLLQEQLVLMKEAHKETEAKWRQEIKAKELAIIRMEEERRSKEAMEVSAKRKTETLRRKIELDFQRHKDDIQRLEHELSRLRASVESTQIICRTNIISAGDSEILKTPSETNVRMLHELNQMQDSSDKEVDYDRECMICTKDEVSVVFLPCAHQVMCASCSQDYGKKGRANCPCCRVQIEQRICVYGASS